MANGDAPDGRMMRLHIALPQDPKGVLALEAAALEIADIEHPRYGKFLTAEEATAMVAPPAEVRDRVVSWLRSAGIPMGAISGSADSVSFDAPVALVEQVFETKIISVVHTRKEWETVVAVGSWSVPAHVADDVEMITGMSDFPIERSSARDGAAKSGLLEVFMNDGNTDTTDVNPYSTPSAYSNSPLGKTFWPQRGRTVPAILRKLYNMPESLKASPKVSIAAVEFQGVDCFSYTDIEAYQRLTGVTFHNITNIINPRGFEPSNCQSESTLDVEQILGLAGGATQMYFGGAGWIYEWSQDYLGLSPADSPDIVSLSYGWAEEGQLNQCQIAQQECSQLGVNSTGYVVRTNVELGKLAAMGKTLCLCTQDEGAPADTNVDGQNSAVPVTPIYPASSPWGLAVGSTVLIDKYPIPASDDSAVTSNPYPGVPICDKIHCSLGDEEHVAMAPNAAFTSGGMFSNVAGQPEWQSAVVQKYLSEAKVKPAAQYFNSHGRAYPDISANGAGVFYVGSYDQGGSTHFEGGTSASTPATAAILAVVSSQLVERGYPAIGYITPTLYKMGQECPECFNAITVGNNTCTGWGRNLPCISTPTDAGFSAQAGWNAAVGHGTPNAANMIDYLIKKNEERIAKFGQ